MATIQFSKVVSSLPGTLAANTVYIVRVGTGVDLYFTDNAGTVAYTINSSGGSSSFDYNIDGGTPFSIPVPGLNVDGGTP